MRIENGRVIGVDKPLPGAAVDSDRLQSADMDKAKMGKYDKSKAKRRNKSNSGSVFRTSSNGCVCSFRFHVGGSLTQALFYFPTDVIAIENKIELGESRLAVPQ